MSHIAHINTFIQSYNYTITMIKRKKIIPFLRYEWSVFVKSIVPLTQLCQWFFFLGGGGGENSLGYLILIWFKVFEKIFTIFF